MMTIEVAEITENEDGSADIRLTVDFNTLVALARVGMMAILESEIARVLESMPDNGSADDEDPPISGEVPAL